jgi:hypothetical protein
MKFQGLGKMGAGIGTLQIQDRKTPARAAFLTSKVMELD